MPPRCPTIQGTLTPFLYPFLASNAVQVVRSSRVAFNSIQRRTESITAESSVPSYEQNSHLNPPPTDYSRTIFADKATVTLKAGSGGHGCISFLREKYIAAGPANGGDGGTGGNVYIQAVRGETSLHKLARRGIMKAGRGKNGQGKTRGGERGDDLIIQVPVGTTIREIERVDLEAEEEFRMKLEAGGEDGVNRNGPYKWSREKWLLYPAITPEDIASAEFPSLPKARKSPLLASQAQAPISLDLAVPMERPILLAAGAVGGLGNPHFVTKAVPRPKFCTKGGTGVSITLELELKLLADVGLVGLPNAGKSTLLRAMSNSKARVGNWAFTTLHPNIGTVVIDNHRERPIFSLAFETGEPRTNFTIADIPGLVQDAHLDKGLGISFLRHVERAGVLAFVVDLNAGDAVEALTALWREVGEYERMKIQEEKGAVDPLVEWCPVTNRQENIIINTGPDFNSPLPPQMPSIAGKPWFVVATKADLPGTKKNFESLKVYLNEVSKGNSPHPSGQSEAWNKIVQAIPVSAINGHGVNQIRDWIINLLEA